MKTLCLLLASAFALPAGAAELPPLNSPGTNAWYTGKMVWADLFTADQDAAAKFYTGLFDWTATTLTRDNGNGPHVYIVLANAGRPIAGIALLRPEHMPNQSHGRWVEYVSVADVGQALSAAVAGGGKIIFPVKSLPQRGTQAIFSDAEGAMLGLLHSASGDPDEFRPDPGDWTWAELFARDTARAAAYYQAAFGYEVLPDSRFKRPDTFLLSSGTYARASVVPLPGRPHAKPAWLGIVRVARLSDTLARATRLGGRILVGPNDIDPTIHLAIIADSVGAAIGLVEHADLPDTGSGLPAIP